jgi:hypothetical protein
MILNLVQQPDPPTIVLLAENNELADLLALHPVADLVMFDDLEKLTRLFRLVVEGQSNYLVVVENLNGFLELYDKLVGSEIAALFYEALAKAEAHQSQFVLTSTRPSGINNKVRANIKQNLVFHLNSEMDYAALDVKRDYQAWLAEDIPGRVLVNQLLGQTIYYNLVEQELVESIVNPLLPAADPLPTLSNLVECTDENPILAQSYDDLSYQYFSSETLPSLIVVCGPKTAPKAKLVNTINKLIRISNAAQDKPASLAPRPLILDPLVIPDIANFDDLDQDEQTAQQIRAAMKTGQTVIVEWTIGNSTNNWQTLQTIKQADYICALNCHELDIQLLYSTPLPRRTSHFPALRGYLIHNDQIRLVQFSEFIDSENYI